MLAYARGVDGGLTDSMQQALESLLFGSQTRRVTIGELYRVDKSLPRPLGRITSRNAANWLRSLFSLPAAMGFPGVVIMFDETERAFHRQSPVAIQAQLAHLRNIVDYCALGTFGGCLILYAAAEDFIDLARKNLDALAQRIEPPALLDGKKFPSSIRSVWTDLDDLTTPCTSEREFFRELAKKITQLGVDAGLSVTSAHQLVSELEKNASRFAGSPTSSIVREFVKRTASIVLQEI